MEDTIHGAKLLYYYLRIASQNWEAKVNFLVELRLAQVKLSRHVLVIIAQHTDISESIIFILTRIPSVIYIGETCAFTYLLPEAHLLVLLSLHMYNISVHLFTLL